MKMQIRYWVLGLVLFFAAVSPSSAVPVRYDLTNGIFGGFSEPVVGTVVGSFVWDTTTQRYLQGSFTIDVPSAPRFNGIWDIVGAGDPLRLDMLQIPVGDAGPPIGLAILSWRFSAPLPSGLVSGPLPSLTSNGSQLFNFQLNVPPIATVAGTFVPTVLAPPAAVPLPATVWLVLAGLSGLAACRYGHKTCCQTPLVHNASKG